MKRIRVANAPCSWGTLEFVGLAGERTPYARMLDELVEAGYTGTELGDWGYMPTDPARLRREIGGRNLEMLGSWVSVAFKNPEAHARGEARALQVARLLASVADLNASGHLPLIVLGDDNGSDPTRTAQAGRATPEIAMDDGAWRTFVAGVERIARAVKAETGLPTVFHPHCAGWVETPEETARFLAQSDPEVVGIVFDTGHCAYGSGGVDPGAVAAGLARFADRIRYVHFKDCQAEVAGQARAKGWDYFEALRHGVFCELGQGMVDFKGVLRGLEAQGYQGWVVVEQDVLPGMGAPKDSARRNRAYLKSIGL